MRFNILALTFLTTLSMIPVCDAATPKKNWDAQLPKAMIDQVDWPAFLDELRDQKLPVTEFVAAARMITLFKDVALREFAYQSLIRLIDRGFAQPVQDLFMSADFVPTGDPNFVDAYYLYKTILNKNRGMETWAKNYTSSISHKDSPKFSFYQAVQAYDKKDYETAENLLQSILKQDLGPENSELIKKSIRTLSRIYFEQKNYGASYSLQKDFLLRLNPIQPADWLEAAWNLYHLDRPSEALGMLYNLESKSGASVGDLEKYALRGMIYRKLCDGESAEKLLVSFDREFGKTLTGLRRGEPLASLPQLMKLNFPGNSEFRQMNALLSGLVTETKKYKTLKKSSQIIARHLSETETRYINRNRRAMMEETMKRAAEKLLMTSEQLRFLQFDVQREKFNPNMVFRPAPAAVTTIEDTAADGFNVRWAQLDDFWRDERNKFRANTVNRCESF
ncbi:MAG: hypothetical protein H7301_03890 [Cryobacterium sp.]|nr:hypothetical protein [Oligoflexia bacterium]